MHWLEQKYIQLISFRLKNYKRKSPELFNFSCPFCGDSEKDKRKARGYVYVKQSKTLFHCHNCNLTYGFNNFLKNLDFQLYSEFCLEKLKDNKSPEQKDLEDFVAKMQKPVFLKSGPLKGLKKVSQLDVDHPTKVFVSKRQIPNPFHAKMFHCPKFFEWCNNYIVPGKFSDEALLYDEPRLLIPFFDKDQSMHALQGRSLEPKSKTRYITIVNDDSKPKVYGLDTIDVNKKTYVLEGPIDSMFLPNAIATAGGDLVAAINSLDKKNIVVVYDAEPRNKHTVDKIQKAIYNGYQVCIWPINFPYKDVNEAIISGLSPEFVKHIIDENTYRDLAARMALNTWSKV